jgi:hypothetical protein
MCLTPRSVCRLDYRRNRSSPQRVKSAPRADVAQLVEHWLPKPRVAGSSPVVRFFFFASSAPAHAHERRLRSTPVDAAASLADPAIAVHEALLVEERDNARCRAVGGEPSAIGAASTVSA